MVNGFRAALGDDRLVTYDSYLFSQADQEVFDTAGDALSWVNLMAYFDYYDSMVDLFQTYANVLGSQRVAIGVKSGKDGQNQSTPLDEVKRLAAYQPSDGSKAGIMLYTLTMDLPYYTGQPLWTYTDAIADNLAT